MKLSGDLQFKLIVLAVAVGASAIIIWRTYKTIDAAIPQVVKDGAQAVGALGGLAVNIVTDPLDAFGIVPADAGTSKQKWVRVNPWDNPNDPVSNNDNGINYNYF